MQWLHVIADACVYTWKRVLLYAVFQLLQPLALVLLHTKDSIFFFLIAVGLGNRSRQLGGWDEKGEFLGG